MSDGDGVEQPSDSNGHKLKIKPIDFLEAKMRAQNAPEFVSVGPGFFCRISRSICSRWILHLSASHFRASCSFIGTRARSSDESAANTRVTPGSGPNALEPERTKYKNDLAAISDQLRQYIHASDKLQLLVPKSASIDAVFSCSGRESYHENVDVLGVLEVVGVKAGYSALFEMQSSTTIKLHVDFGPVEYSI